MVKTGESGYLPGVEKLKLPPNPNKQKNDSKLKIREISAIVEKLGSGLVSHRESSRILPVLEYDFNVNNSILEIHTYLYIERHI